MLALHDWHNAHASVLFWDIIHETFSMTVRESVGHVVGGTGIIWKAGRGAGKVTVEVGLSGISFLIQ